MEAGLIGPMVITRKGMARPDGSLKDVDREFAMLFMLIDENMSHYLKQNMDAYLPESKLLLQNAFSSRIGTGGRLWW